MPRRRTARATPVAWRMIQVLELARETRLEPGDGTTRVTIVSATTGDLDRSVDGHRPALVLCASRLLPCRVRSQDCSLRLVLRVMDNCCVSDLPGQLPRLNKRGINGGGSGHDLGWGDCVKVFSGRSQWEGEEDICVECMPWIGQQLAAQLLTV